MVRRIALGAFLTTMLAAWAHGERRNSQKEDAAPLAVERSKRKALKTPKTDPTCNLLLVAISTSAAVFKPYDLASQKLAMRCMSAVEGTKTLLLYADPANSLEVRLNTLRPKGGAKHHFSRN